MSETPHPEATPLLVVDDDVVVRGVISALLEDEGYAVTTVANAAAAEDALRAAEIPVVVSDVRMPGHDGFWLLERIRELRPDTAVIMLTGFGDTEAAVECLRSGAADYLLKPPKVTDLVRAIERALGRRKLALERRRYREGLELRVQKKTAELSRALVDLESTYSQTLWTLVAALDAREHETSDHSRRVVRYTLAIAERLGIPEREWAAIGRGALLHDIGKIGVPDAILLKPGTLTPDEWVEMRRHPQIGFDILRSVHFLAGPAELVLSHQERFDGGGYPRGLAGDAIPLAARVFAIADTFDAMTSDRPYRGRLPLEAARAEIARSAGTQLDPRCVAAFQSLSVDELAHLALPADGPGVPDAPGRMAVVDCSGL
ncbi:HD-GYP domain-containing protein [Anaeromyxobacter oryzisoli]|uniref:HD-GYP domain-containing protein n=1 Tax=Anaeromyxobacter oryzisoli TaxID=2925408 RepID=UPI001F58DCD2|nr:HD domain-containing phosphohydrolase [Anaeromyxobacter sp. SG63]